MYRRNSRVSLAALRFLRRGDYRGCSSREPHPGAGVSAYSAIMRMRGYFMGGALRLCVRHRGAKGRRGQLVRDSERRRCALSEAQQRSENPQSSR